MGPGYFTSEVGRFSAVNIAPSSFLASVHSSSELVAEILPPTSSRQRAPFVIEAKSAWSAGHVFPTPEGTAATKQKSWDSVRTVSTAQHLLDTAANDAERAQLLAVFTKEPVRG